MSDETQRRYERAAGVKVTANVGFAPESLIEQEIEAGNCLVPTDDRDETLGRRYFYKRRGDKQNVYWRTVNTYTADDTDYERAPTGNSRKVNRRLRAVAHGETVPQRVYYQSELAQVRSFVTGHCYQLLGVKVTDFYCYRCVKSGEKIRRIVSARVWKYEKRHPFSGNSRERFS